MAELRYFLYLMGRVLGDINAIQKSRVPRRIARRTTGKLIGRKFMRKI